MNEEFIEALKDIVREKGISEALIFDTMEDALVAAYKKNYAKSGVGNQSVRVTIDRENGEIKVYSAKEVVEESYDDVTEITLEDARAVNPRYEIGDICEIEVTPKKFGRVAAQSAKQVVVQRIKEAERNIIFDEFSEKAYDIITGIIVRKEKNNVYIDLGKVEAVLLPAEQLQGEKYNFNERIKLYISEVKNGGKGPQVVVSRTHPNLVKRLFEMEIPEVFDGTVEIKSISREASFRTKIAVHSKDKDVDAVGSCVGNKRSRIDSITNELCGEKIDIIKWDKDPKEYISNALSPAKVLSVEINEEDKSSKVVVDDNQLSLAIGKEGQNVRLAAKLTGWRIDIKSKSQVDTSINAEKENVELIDEEVL